LSLNKVPAPYPLILEPSSQPKIWGGRKSHDRFQKKLPTGGRLGETWEVSDLPGCEATITNGAFSGLTLDHAVSTWGESLIGKSLLQGHFPLLIKLIDAKQDLSIQVHPGERDIKKHALNAKPKDECWIILETEPGAKILHGLKDGCTKEILEKAIQHDQAEEYLRSIPVHPGDVIHIPPGTIHAICHGVMLLEIQQPSDTTYRVYDYGRKENDGTPRSLHLKEALQVIRFENQPAEKISPIPITNSEELKHSLLHESLDYRIERIAATKPVSWNSTPHSFQVVMSPDVTIEFTDQNKNSFELTPGQFALLPACSNRFTVTRKIQGAFSFFMIGCPGKSLFS